MKMFTLFTALVLGVVLQLPAQTPGTRLPRTADGHPDLQGIWTNATLTPVQRPAAFANKPTLGDAEAKAYEKHELEVNNIDNQNAPILVAAGSGSGDTAVGGYNSLFWDRGSELARVNGIKRTSLIVDPPDGRVPPYTAEAQKRFAAARSAAPVESFDNFQLRPLSERCLLGFGSTAGPPMLPVYYNGNYQIIQTPGTIMILVEMDHDVRVIRMNGKHISPPVRQWLGDSVGHWDGDTLVVDTTDFRSDTHFQGSTDRLHVVERFTRLDAKTILYKAVIEDPSTFSRPWTMEFPFVSAPGPIYEYACHEGNYAMTDILGGAKNSEAR